MIRLTMRMQEFLEAISPIANCSNFTDNSRSCWEILRKYFDMLDLTSSKPFDFAAAPDHDATIVGFTI